MNKIEPKQTTVAEFKDWAKRHGLPIMVDDKKLKEALDRSNEKTRKAMQSIAKEVKK